MKRLVFGLFLTCGSFCVAACSGTDSNLVTTMPASQSSAAAHKSATQVYVPADEPYTDSGIAVQGNEQIDFTASGTANWREACKRRCVVGPDGYSLKRPKCKKLQKSRFFGPFTAPGLPCFSLIGKIGSNGSPFEVGSSLDYTVPSSVSGELYLGFNDNDYGDNTGGFSAEISH